MKKKGIQNFRKSVIIMVPADKAANIVLNLWRPHYNTLKHWGNLYEKSIVDNHLWLKPEF